MPFLLLFSRPNLDCLFIQRESMVLFVICPEISIEEGRGEMRWSVLPGFIVSLIEDAFISLA